MWQINTSTYKNGILTIAMETIKSSFISNEEIEKSIYLLAKKIQPKILRFDLTRVSLISINEIEMIRRQSYELFKINIKTWLVNVPDNIAEIFADDEFHLMNLPHNSKNLFFSNNLISRAKKNITSNHNNIFNTELFYTSDGMFFTVFQNALSHEKDLIIKEGAKIYAK